LVFVFLCHGSSPFLLLRIIHLHNFSHTLIILEIDNKEFTAKSVIDLYSKILRFLFESNHIQKLKPYIPYATSRQRYLISNKPIHPQGNEFRIPTEYKGYYMETNKGYDNAIKGLSDFLGLIGLSVNVKQ
jgi:hypothetical protein